MKSIKPQISKIKEVVGAEELLKRLRPETQKTIRNMPEGEWLRGYKQMKASEKRRLKLLKKAINQ